MRASARVTARRRRREHRQLEEGVGDLQHEDVRVPVVVHDEDALDGAPHAKVLVVVLQALEARGDGGVLLGLGLLGAGRGAVRGCKRALGRDGG